MKTLTQHNIEEGQNLNIAWSIVAAEVSDGSRRSPEGYAERFRELLAVVRAENAAARTAAWNDFKQEAPQ